MRPLPKVETRCVEHARRLLSDRMLTSHNDSGITVKECARHSEPNAFPKSQSANLAIFLNLSWGMPRFEQCRQGLWTAAGSK